MAIDSQSPLNSPADASSSVIENELPAYRAISARAVTSVVLGCVSVFCFTSLIFLLVVVASVLFGWSALRAIKRYPDILTGSSLAKTGIGLALVFGLTAGTRAVVEDIMLVYDAGKFAKEYVEILKTQPVANAIYYKQPVSYRQEETPAELEDELKKAKNPSSPNMYETEIAPVVAIKEQLKKPNTTIHFSKIESRLIDGLSHYANALIDVDVPGDEQFLLVELVKDPGEPWGGWRVRDLRFPYKPASSAAFADKKAADDGHGHSH